AGEARRGRRRGRVVQHGPGEAGQPGGAEAVPPGPGDVAATPGVPRRRAQPRVGGGHRALQPAGAAPVPGRGGVCRAEAGGNEMSPQQSRRPRAKDSAEQHREWLNLVEVSGPFLSMPVLRRAWPDLDALENKPALRAAHATWQADTVGGQRGWLEFVLGELL